MKPRPESVAGWPVLILAVVSAFQSLALAVLLAFAFAASLFIHRKK